MNTYLSQSHHVLTGSVDNGDSGCRCGRWVSIEQKHEDKKESNQRQNCEERNKTVVKITVVNCNGNDLKKVRRLVENMIIIVNNDE